ncbi:DUF3817 domain-containing protein [Saccharopolyspora sp. MS10]|uniref:DUF3817 domain-containing protein n=1 Tax=Saccharopolyspora sp. MS10 TaxID=3385973 RepID=UPI0039A27367
MPGELRLLRVAAVVEAGSLLVLLVNLVTAHWAPVTSGAGPVHGCAYLVTVAATFAATRSARARGWAFVPGAGGLLALREVGRAAGV